MTSTTTTETVHESEYLGHKVEVIHRPEAISEAKDYGKLPDGTWGALGTTHTYVSRNEHLEARLDGKTYQGYTGPATDQATTIKKLVDKVHKTVDRWNADDAILADVRTLIGTLPDKPLENGWKPVEASTVTVGQVAAIHGFGDIRIGRVTKVSRKNAEVAYTTRSNPDSVNRKSDSTVWVQA